jgi:PAS domain S-box-containing protein
MRLRNLSIRDKLTLITMLTSFVALLLAAAAFMTYELVTFRQTLARDYSILADMSDDNVAAGLAFNQLDEVEGPLNNLGADSHIMAALVYDTNRTAVARYERADLKGHFTPPPVERSGSFFRPGRLETFQPITLKGENYGTICIVTDLAEMDVRFRRYLLIAAAVLLTSSMVALWLSSKLRNIIAEPILALAKTVRVVAEDKNYSVRAQKKSEDELGSLIDGFNNMLSEIQERDVELQEGRDKLEARVLERTRELQAERDLLSTLLDNSPDHIYFKDKQSKFLRCGRSLYRRLGASSNEEVVGKSDFDFFNEADARAAFEAEQEIVRTGIPIIGRVQKEVWKAGQVTWVLVTKMPYHNAANEIIGTFGISKDITALKEAESRAETAHQELLNVSRMAGMAEVATGVLHNVGNVLNSVNVSATLVSDRIRQSPIKNLAQLHTLMQEQGPNLATFLVDDPRGRNLPVYLRALADHLAKEQTETLEELDSLRKNIEHIKEIVAMQQGYAHQAGFVETVSMVELVEHALVMNARAMARHTVDVVRDYQAEPVLTLEKHKVMQILVNLMRNAKYACDESEQAHKEVKVQITKDDSQVRIAIIDNGIGIPAENLTRIFSHGFTTRKDGHGFGLHSAALAAKSLGGSLTATSEGVRKGATFTLTLPLT